MSEEQSEFISAGQFYVLGRWTGGYGVWAKTPDGRLGETPVATFPSSPDGEAQAWEQFSRLEMQMGRTRFESPTTPPAGTEVPIELEPDKHKWYSPRWWWVIPVAALLAAGVGIGVLSTNSASNPTPQSRTSSNSTGSTQPAVGTGYLADLSGEVIFIQWNQSGDSFSGTAQDDSVTGNPPDQTLSTQTLNVNGELNGSSISLSFSGGNQEFGTIAFGQFTLNFPQQDGTLAPVTFHAASSNEFNADVGTLHSEISQDNQTAANQQAIAKQEAVIDSDIKSVNNDISGLANASLSSDLDSLGGDVQRAQSDLAATASQAQTAEGESGSQNQCYDAGTANYDAGTVEYDAGTVGYDANSVKSDVQSLRSAISAIGSDFQKMQSDEQAVPTYHPNAPNQDAVNQAIATAQQVIGSAVSSTNSAVAEVNGYVTTAYMDANGALQSGPNCGSGSTTPTSVPQIQ
jgi:hypothetical protein